MKKDQQMQWSVWLLLGCITMGLSGVAQAATDTKIVPTTKREVVPQEDQRIELKQPKAGVKKAAKKKVKAPKKKPQGWFPKLSLGINTLLNHSSSVPGVDDGFTFSLGIVLTGELLYLNKKHEWKSTLKGVHTQTKTPSIGPFVKTADNLDIQSFYTYRFGGPAQLGLFGGLQLSLSLFPGDLVVAADTQLVLINGTRRERKLAIKDQPFSLTPSLSPLIFKQKGGLEAKPFEDKFARLQLKLNAAAQEVFASGYVLQDDAATTDLELQALRDYVQFGVEMEVKLAGQINKRISYEFGVELMYPVVTSIETELQGFDLLNAELGLKVSVKLLKWASLDYVFNAKLVPLLSRRWQVTNNLVLSLKADFL